MNVWVPKVCHLGRVARHPLSMTVLEQSKALDIRLYLMAFYLDKEESLSPEIFIISTILTAMHELFLEIRT